MSDFSSRNGELEKAICKRADAEFKIAIREWRQAPISKEKLQKSAENINREPGHRGLVFRTSYEISIEYEIIPLIKKLIQIEYDLRITNHVPFSEARIIALKQYLREYIKEQWHYIIYEAYRDSLNYVIQNNHGSLLEYEEKEIEERRDEYLQAEPEGLYEIVNEMVDRAAADSMLNALASQDGNRGGNMEKPNKPRTTILFLSADPSDGTRSRLGKEFAEIKEQLRLAKQRDQFTLLIPELSVRARDISGALLEMRPNIVHFSGHGLSNGALAFENMIGQSQQVPPAALAALFQRFSNVVECVVLNACYSSIQAQAIAEHIPYVIGMKQAIGDEAARAFSLGFYQALGAGDSFEDAYHMGCIQIGLHDIPEDLTPALIKKGQPAP